MMGKISFGKSFRKSLQYCLQDKKQELEQKPVLKDRAEILYYHQCHGNIEELARQFREVVQLNPNLSKPVIQLSLSLPPGENLSKSKLVQLGQECARHMDFEKHQYVVILHKDTVHQHVHIVGNSLGPDMHVTRDSFSYARMDKFCREAEIRHGLKQTLSGRRFRDAEGQELPRQGIRLDKLKENIRESLLLSKDLREFTERMEERGYSVWQSERGISFRSDRVGFRGYEAGYSLRNIQSVLSIDLTLRQKQEQDRLEELRLKQKLQIEGSEEHLRQQQTHRQQQRHSHRLRL